MSKKHLDAVLSTPTLVLELQIKVSFWVGSWLQNLFKFIEPWGNLERTNSIFIIIKFWSSFFNHNSFFSSFENFYILSLKIEYDIKKVPMNLCKMTGETHYEKIWSNLRFFFRTLKSFHLEVSKKLFFHSTQFFPKQIMFYHSAPT